MPKYPARTYEDIPKRQVDFEYLHNKFKLKNLETQKKFGEKFPHVDNFFKQKGLELGKLRQHSAKVLSASAIASALLLTSPSDDLKLLPAPQEILEKLKSKPEEGIQPGQIKNPQEILVETLSSFLPKRSRPLARSEEKFLEQIFSNLMGVNVRASLEGEHLNTTYGYIGAEQHLRRFPGDSVSSHGEGKVLSEGMAPGFNIDAVSFWISTHLLWRSIAYCGRDEPNMYVVVLSVL